MIYKFFIVYDLKTNILLKLRVHTYVLVLCVLLDSYCYLIRIALMLCWSLLMLIFMKYLFILFFIFSLYEATLQSGGTTSVS